MLSPTIPYGRNISVRYIPDDQEPNARIRKDSIDIELRKNHAYDALVGFLISSTIANTISEEGLFSVSLVPDEDDIITVKSDSGDTTRFKLYNDVLVKI